MWSVEGVIHHFENNDDRPEQENEGDHEDGEQHHVDLPALADLVHELQGRTPKEVPFVEVIFFKLGAAQPAPLIPALGASHVVAPFVLYFSYSCLTLGAIYYIAFIFGPVEILNIIGLHTCLSFML